MDSLGENVLRIKNRLEALAAEAGYGGAPRLIAVSKTRPVEEVNRLAGMGVFDIGENRVQEIMAKYPQLDERFRVHLIGRLQSNKVKYIIDKVCQIQSVDRLALAEEIHRRALDKGAVMPVLIQVSPAGEDQKGGVLFSETKKFLKEASRLEGIRIEGLMAMMPLISDRDTLNGLFRKTRLLFEQMRDEAIGNVCMQELSMGMSGDFELAVLNGATSVRLGSVLFSRQEG